MSVRRPRFSGHQTFSFRYGWLEKGYSFIKSGKRFGDADALMALGVGKNMVESIRYWCEGFGLMAEQGTTPFADALLDPEKGWDPCLEDDASLWLLHWRYCTQKRFMNAATLLFGEVHKPEIGRQEWLDMLQRRDGACGGKGTSLTMLERDMECCLKMYSAVKASGKKRVLELSYACPFQELGLLSLMETGNALRFAIGPKAGLPPEVLGYAIWEYLQASQHSGARLSEFMHADYAPGQIFMLDENSFVEYIETLNQSRHWRNFFTLTSSAGVETVHCTLQDGNDLLKAYYGAATE